MTVPATKGRGEQDRPVTQRQRIVPHLWFDDQAEEAASFYTSLFDDSKIGAVTRYGKEGFEIHRRPEGSVMTVDFELAGYGMIALNGGPVFDITPAISFFVTGESEAEVDELWQALSSGGEALMELGSYPWSEKYGWVRDRFGLTWQIYLGNLEDVHGQKISPCLMFSSEEGMAEAAMNRYVSIFENSSIDGISRYGDMGGEPANQIAHAQFLLDGELLMAMDSTPDNAPFNFNEAVSLLVNCESQEEIDHYWERLSEGGDPKAQQCGWLKDRFGVSWQVNPVELQQMLLDPNPSKVARVTNAFLQMKKFDMAALRAAYEG